MACCIISNVIWGSEKLDAERLLTTPCIGSDRAIINYVKGVGSREGQIKLASFLSFGMLNYTHTTYVEVAH